MTERRIVSIDGVRVELDSYGVPIRDAQEPKVRGAHVVNSHMKILIDRIPSDMGVVDSREEYWKTLVMRFLVGKFKRIRNRASSYSNLRIR